MLPPIMELNQLNRLMHQNVTIEKSQLKKIVQAIPMDFIDQKRVPLFKSDIGCYFRVKMLDFCHAKRLKCAEVAKILGTSDSKIIYQKIDSVINNENENIGDISEQIDLQLESRAKSKQNSKSPFSNIKKNYLLKYFGSRVDAKLGGWLFHEPVIITLDELISKGKLKYLQKIKLMGQILEIMEFLQKLKIVHRCITSFSFVFTYADPNNYNPLIKISQIKQNFKYNPNIHQLKITGFYQSIQLQKNFDCTTDYPVRLFNNIYSDPNYYSFSKIDYQSDIWSVILVIFELLTEIVPDLKVEEKIEKGLNLLLSWQKEMFRFYFKGTKQVKITLRDLIQRWKKQNTVIETSNRMWEEKEKQRLEANDDSEFESIRKLKKMIQNDRKQRSYSFKDY